MNLLFTHLSIINKTVSPTLSMAVSIASILLLSYLYFEIREINKLRSKQKSIHQQLNELSEKVYRVSAELNDINRHTQTEILINKAFRNAPTKACSHANRQTIPSTKNKWQHVFNILNNDKASPIEILEKKFPILSQSEIQHFLLKNHGLQQQEIAEILEVPKQTLPVRWYTICKKLQINTEILNVEVSNN
ncbi:MAG: hypothetical protein DI598_15505 [Pseudopedobacter saltans]|uniref:Uncharacterized protein n=1 Tax=Pseudopedobacter saltans TaxID=151895 RepID=A0A2W5GK84_9SPHI|nr:MAG: hypothetical protein DI598_15505 [Pseudopedobacter saltans]